MSTRRSLLQLRFDDLEAATGGQANVTDYIINGGQRPDARDRAVPVNPVVTDRRLPADLPPAADCGCRVRQQRLRRRF